MAVATEREYLLFINGEPTYRGHVWNGHKIEGLLMNSRMVQGIFDDLNPETRGIIDAPTAVQPAGRRMTSRRRASRSSSAATAASS